MTIGEKTIFREAENKEIYWKLFFNFISFRKFLHTVCLKINDYNHLIASGN